MLGLIVLLLVVRPLVRRIITPEGSAAAALLAAAGIDPATGGLAYAGGISTGPGGPNVIVGGDQATATISTHTSQMIDIAQVQGQVHAESVKKVGELADKNPQETVAIIRSWLHDSA